MGHGTSSGRGGGEVNELRIISNPRFVGSNRIESEIRSSSTYGNIVGVTVDSIRYVTNPDPETGMATVEADISQRLRIPYGYDRELGRTEYGEEEEYQTVRHRVQVWNRA